MHILLGNLVSLSTKTEVLTSRCSLHVEHLELSFVHFHEDNKLNCLQLRIFSFFSFDSLIA
jgi:hypothetical protein